jgi:hypothetical protein
MECGKAIEPYTAKLRRRDFLNEPGGLSNISPSLFPSLHISARYIRHPRDRSFDLARLIVFVRVNRWTSLSATLKVLAHDLRSPFGRFCDHEVPTWLVSKIRLRKGARARLVPRHSPHLPAVTLPDRSNVQPRLVRLRLSVVGRNFALAQAANCG